MGVLRHPEASQDLDEIVDYLAQFDPRVAVRFVTAVEKTAAVIERLPTLGEAYPSTSSAFRGIRRTTVKRFRKYVIYYRVIESGIEVLRILHGLRNAKAIIEDDEGK
jgi:toxin ParE1/3/4